MKKLRLSVLLIAAVALTGTILYIIFPKAHKPDSTSYTDNTVTPGDSTYVYSTVPLIENGTILTIGASTQGEAGDLRIGVGGVRLGEYVVEGTGMKEEGRIAGLWIYVRGDSSKNQQLDVYIGKQFEVDKYTVTILDIRGGSSYPIPGGSGGSVQLQIDQLPPDAATWFVLKNGNKVLWLQNKPGVLISAAEPAFGMEPLQHPFVNAKALDPLEENNLRSILDASKDFDDFVSRLQENGYTLQEAP